MQKETLLMKGPFRLIAACAAAGLSALGLMSASSLASATLPNLTLTVTKNKVVVAGQKVSGAVNIVTTVSGEPSDSPLLFLLKPGVTAKQFGKALSQLGNDTPADAIDPYATIVFDGGTDLKGTPTTVQADLPAGNYVAGNNGSAFTPFTIAKSSAPANLPHPGATITAIDFGFKGAATLHQGELVRFENDGYLIHMFVYGQLKSRADVKPVEAELLKGASLQKAASFTTSHGLFAGPLSTGQYQQQVITQSPGTYIILCAMNAQDGRDHYQLGMFREIHILPQT
jgi:hypothetical protein